MKKCNLPKWKVDEQGEVQRFWGYGPNNELLYTKTKSLEVNLGGEIMEFDGWETTLVPAIPNEDGGYEWWENLPTR